MKAPETVSSTEARPGVSKVLVIVLMIIMFIIGAGTAYLFGIVGSRTVTSVYTSTSFSTVLAPSMTLENFELCSHDTCGNRSSSISGMIILGSGSPMLTSIHLFVNSTDLGIESCYAASRCQVQYPLGLVFYSQSWFQNPQIVGGQWYDVKLVATFQGNITSTAYVVLLAQ
jgi:hypothetical protein